MKKLLLFTIICFALFFDVSFAQMQLSLPSDLPQQDDVILYSTNDNIKFTEKEIRSQMNLRIPEAAGKVQSDYVRVAKMLVALHFLLALPLGDFGEFYSTGFGGNLTFAYLLATQIYLTASLGYLSWGISHDLPEGVEQSFSTIPFLIGVRYLLATGRFMPYILAQIGLHFLTFSYKYSFGNINVDDSKTETKFGLGAGAGFFYILSAALMLDISARYWYFSQEDSVSNIVFLLGLAYALGSTGGM